MKTSLFTIAIVICLYSAFLPGAGKLFAQTIRRCNNNPGVTGVNVYTTIQAAHDAAVAGDIIYVDPSDNGYGDLDARKRLTIIGNGYFLTKNSNVSFDPRTSKTNIITFNNGSANSIMMGVDVVSYIAINDVNVTVTRCKIGSSINFGISANLIAGQNSRGNNGTITKCLMGGTIEGLNSTNVTIQRGYNCVISNNIINGGRISNITNSTISNNIFYVSPTYSEVSLLNLFSCNVSNNIFDARGISNAIQFVSGGSGNTISNNICLSQSGTPSGNGNVNFGDESTTFLVSNPWTTFSTEDSKFQLAASSPAKAIGTGGTDAGVFGGASPYVLSGLPPYPIITNFTTTGVGNTSVPLQVSVTVRGNN